MAQGGTQSAWSSSSKILIKGGTVVNAHHQQIADVYVEDGIVVAVQPNINVLFSNLSSIYIYLYISY